LPLSTPRPPQSHSPLLVDVDGDGHVEVNIADADLVLKISSVEVGNGRTGIRTPLLLLQQMTVCSQADELEQTCPKTRKSLQYQESCGITYRPCRRWCSSTGCQRSKGWTARPSHHRWSNHCPPGPLHMTTMVRNVLASSKTSNSLGLREGKRGKGISPEVGARRSMARGSTSGP